MSEGSRHGLMQTEVKTLLAGVKGDAGLAEYSNSMAASSLARLHGPHLLALRAALVAVYLAATYAAWLRVAAFLSA